MCAPAWEESLRSAPPQPAAAIVRYRRRRGIRSWPRSACGLVPWRRRAADAKLVCVLIDEVQPYFDATRVEHRIVDGEPAAVYEAALRADFVRTWRLIAEEAADNRPLTVV